MKKKISVYRATLAEQKAWEGRCSRRGGRPFDTDLGVFLKDGL